MNKETFSVCVEKVSSVVFFTGYAAVDLIRNSVGFVSGLLVVVDGVVDGFTVVEDLLVIGVGVVVLIVDFVVEGFEVVVVVDGVVELGRKVVGAVGLFVVVVVVVFVVLVVTAGAFVDN